MRKAPRWRPIPGALGGCGVRAVGVPAVGVPAAAWHWLSYRQSITRHLTAVCGGAVQVRVHRQRRQAIAADEAALLAAWGAGPAVVREVCLLVKDQPMVWARTVLPQRTAVGLNRPLLQLGASPLGAALFAGGRLPQRWRVEYSAQCAVAGGPACWARRTVYVLHGRPLLVCEAFAPALWRRA